MIEAGRLTRAIHLTAKRIDVDAYLVSGGSQDHTVEVLALREIIPKTIRARPLVSQQAKPTITSQPPSVDG